MAQPQRVVTDTMAGLSMPDFDIWSERVATVLGQNPGPFTGPGQTPIWSVQANGPSCSTQALA